MTFEPRNPNKSAAELELDTAMAEYEKRFGKPYVFQMGFHNLTTEETIAEIRQLIATGKKQKLHRYDSDKVY